MKAQNGLPFIRTLDPVLELFTALLGPHSLSLSESLFTSLALFLLIHQTLCPS